jgi:hypothetical protein
VVKTCVTLLAVCSPLALALAAVTDWQSSVTKIPPGSFAELRPLRATYNFGWSGLTAATAEAHFSKRSDNRFQFEGGGRTVGLARALWRYDVDFRALSDAATLRPIETDQTETVRSKKIATHLSFSNSGVNRARAENGLAPTSRDLLLPNVFDLHSAVLYLRSQPLKDGASYRVIVYPTTSAYLATVTVAGREKITVHAGTYNAIKVDLKLSKVDKELVLQPHRKFRKATAWISDDSDRIILRAEAQIFIGTIFGELQSVKFANP